VRDAGVEGAGAGAGGEVGGGQALGWGTILIVFCSPEVRFTAVVSIPLHWLTLLMSSRSPLNSDLFHQLRLVLVISSECLEVRRVAAQFCEFE
jgi:hypothetical protein